MSQCGTHGLQEPVLLRTAEPFNVRFRADGFFTQRGFSYVIIPEPRGESPGQRRQVGSAQR